MQMVNIGFGNMVAAARVVAIISPDAAPIRRLVQEARERHELVDATAGRRMRAVMIMDSGHILLSALQPETLSGRIQEGEGEK